MQTRNRLLHKILRHYGLNFADYRGQEPGSTRQTEELEFLVDAGAVYSVVPAPTCGGWDFDRSRRRSSG
jgi:hypothetical protein